MRTGLTTHEDTLLTKKSQVHLRFDPDFFFHSSILICDRLGVIEFRAETTIIDFSSLITFKWLALQCTKKEAIHMSLENRSD